MGGYANAHAERKKVFITQNLLSGISRSCGCLVNEGIIEKREKLGLVEGTSLSQLRSKKLSSNNKSGVRGVYWKAQAGLWIANIGFKGKQITLGCFKEFSDAVAARKAAEEKYFAPILEKYKKNSGTPD